MKPSLLCMVQFFSQSNLTGVIATRDDAINALENNESKGPFIVGAKGGMDKAQMRLAITPLIVTGKQIGRAHV